MWPYLKPLLSWHFWFTALPQPFTQWAGRFLLILMLALLLGGVGIRAYVQLVHGLEKDRRRLLRRIALCLFSAGFSGLILYGFTWQEVPLLSMRFFYVVWFVSFAAWGFVIGKYALKDLPLLRAEQAERAAYEKWLPKAKK